MTTTPATLQKDKRIQTLEKLILNHKLSTYAEETTKIHSVRMARYLLPNLSLSDLQKAAVNESSYRSRLVEILMTVKTFSSALGDYLESMETYLFKKYPDLYEGLRYKTDRALITDKILRKYNKVYVEAAAIEENIELIITDIDKKAYTLRLLMDTIQLATQREYTG